MVPDREQWPAVLVGVAYAAADDFGEGDAETENNSQILYHARQAGGLQ